MIEKIDVGRFMDSVIEEIDIFIEIK